MSDELEDDLDRWMGVEDDGWYDAEPPPLVEIEGLEHADRLLRRKARLDRDEADVRALAAQRHAQIAAWENDRTEGIQRTRSWLDTSLEAFMRAYHAANGTQTVKLPNGTLALSKAPDKIVAPVDDALMSWLNEARRSDWIKPGVDAARLGDIKKGTVVGPLIEDDEDRGWNPAPEGYEYHAVVEPGGEIVPGVAYLVPTRKAFKATPTKEDPTKETDDDDDR